MIKKFKTIKPDKGYTSAIKRRCLFFILLFALSFNAKAQLIINEFSQGANGTQEYIELVVAGQRNCAGDSCMDIRGWIIDDNNGWYGASAAQGIAPGHMRFSNDPNWSCVPYGSIILLYNLGDKNPVITMTDDPTDANNDNVYVLPSVSSLIEGTTATPVSPSSLTYVYPSAITYAVSPAWNAIGLANTGDAVIVVNPATPGVALHSIAYGNLTSATSAVINKTTAGGARNYYLTNNQYTSSAAYNVGNAPTDETPGAPNTAANTAWINSMLTNVSGALNFNIFTCIQQGDSFNFNGEILTSSGVYIDTLNTSSGCDSIIHLNLSVVTPTIVNGIISSCQPVVFNGTIYTASTFVNDTLLSTLGCDSAYLNMIIQIETITAIQVWDTVSGCQSIVYNGIPYQVSQQITDTMRTLAGCDSVYKRIYLNILPIPQISVPPDLMICKGDTMNLTANALYPVTWDGHPQGNSIIVSPDESTAYVARVYNELNCEGNASVTVTMENFTLTLNSYTTEAEIGIPVELNVTANNDFVVNAWWPRNIFANQQSKQQNITFNEKGIEYITVAAESINNCKDTATVAINILPKPFVFIPGAFTPNGDGMNDYFKPEFIRDHFIHDFSIFNRWGQRVYAVSSTQQLGDGWDGTFHNERCDTGTYYYILSLHDPQNKELIIKGDVILVNQ